jgi:site-specific DNA-methyltransferase (adenine-specific)
MNHLYYGDNLEVLRDSIADESIDLVYLDPPFNSKRDYNLLFKSPKGQQSEAQITAFEDSWHWGPQAEREFDELLHQPNTDVAEMMRALRGFLGDDNDIMAYLTMMANRLLELHRTLAPTGSLYLHCDPTASHYLKLVLDAVFGATQFRSEIIWKRTNARSTPDRWPRVHDVILFYGKSDSFVFNSLKVPADKAKMPHTLITWSDGFKYQTYELTAPGATSEGESGKAWRGFDPNAFGRHWANTIELREDWDKQELIHWPKPGSAGGFPRRRDEVPFDAESREVTVGDVWTDVDRLNQTAKERLGYPTQKPLALLERIIQASSNEGDVVLDPFCGCGTAVHAAQKLNRQWIGIDITHLAISLIEKRLKDAFGAACTFEVHGTPEDLDSARDLASRDKYQFQWWAVSLVDGQPFQGKKKGADTGIDGLKFFHDLEGDAQKIVISVKGGGSLKPDDIRAVNHVREREKAEIALLISLAEPSPKMKAEAAAAGIYSGGPEGKQKFARLQLLTIEGLLSGNQRAEHPDYVPNVNFKKAVREKPTDRQKKLL